MEKESMFFNGVKEIAVSSLFKEVRNSFTLEFWVKPSAPIHIDQETNSGVSGLTGQRFLMGPGHGELENEAGVGVSIGTNGVIVYEHSSFYLPALLVFPMTITDWTHVAVVYLEKTPHLYINGKLKRKGLTSNKESLYPSGFLGGYEPYGYYFGYLKEVKIWNIARTEEQIKECLFKELTHDEPGLFKHWTFKAGIQTTTQKNLDESNHDSDKKELKLFFVKTGIGFPYPPIESAIIKELNNTVKEVTVLSPYEDILALAKEKKPNIILYINHGLTINTSDLKKLKRMGIKTAAWFTDDPYYIDHTKRVASYFNIIFTTELNCVHLYKMFGCPNVFYLPLAANTEIFFPKKVDAKYQSDILFVGNAFTERLRLIDSISEYLAKKNVLIIGFGWEKLKNYHLLSNKIRQFWEGPEETANYYNGAKIVLNSHRSFDDSTINFNRSKVPALSVNPRTFEITACASFQLTDIRLDLKNQYTPFYDIVTYTSDNDLIEKVEHFLPKHEERIEIAKRGLQKTLGEHTYSNRINKLVDKLFF